MRKISLLVASMVSTQIVGCAATAKNEPPRDVAHYPYPEAQARLREVLEIIINDTETANVAGNRDVHLNSEKFTKFPGRSYDRMSFEQCVAAEAAAITSVEDYKYEARDVKIDVFGEVAVMTYFPHRSRREDGEMVRYSARQTLVFLKTRNGWKIVHEHQSQVKFED